MIIKYKKLFEKYPFLTILRYNDEEFIGIVQNQDDMFTGLYDITACTSPESLARYLSLAEQWWWESNRMIPINIFLKADWLPFSTTLRTFNTKNLEVVSGHVVNLNSINQKRIKRRSIQLVKTPK